MADVTSVLEYYKNLLIIQYHGKPKAQAFISLLVDEIIASGVILDVLNGYNLDDAVGVQLDVLGKYIGVDRFYVGNDLTDMFSLVTYAEITAAGGDMTNAIFNGRWGFVTYANYDSVNENGVLNYNSILTVGFQLNDNDYRTLLKFKIIKNYSDGSHKSIDDALFRFFGNDVVMTQTDVMEITYTVPFSLTPVMLAAISKGVLPKPAAVALVLAETP